AIEAGEAGACDAEGVGVLGAPELAKHLLRFDHAAHDVFVHVVGDAGLGKALKHPRIGVARARSGSQRVRDFESWIYRHLHLYLLLIRVEIEAVPAQADSSGRGWDHPVLSLSQGDST